MKKLAIILLSLLSLLPLLLRASQKNSVVTETGLFNGEGQAKSIKLLTCTPKE